MRQANIIYAGTMCFACGAGTYSINKGGSTCFNCSAGYYSSTPGSSSCNLCLHGVYQPGSGGQTCLFCTVCNGNLYYAQNCTNSTNAVCAVITAIQSSASPSSLNSPTKTVMLTLSSRFSTMQMTAMSSSPAPTPASELGTKGSKSNTLTQATTTPYDSTISIMPLPTMKGPTTSVPTLNSMSTPIPTTTPANTDFITTAFNVSIYFSYISDNLADQQVFFQLLEQAVESILQLSQAWKVTIIPIQTKNLRRINVLSQQLCIVLSCLSVNSSEARSIQNEINGASFVDRLNKFGFKASINPFQSGPFTGASQNGTNISHLIASLDDHQNNGNGSSLVLIALVTSVGIATLLAFFIFLQRKTLRCRKEKNAQAIDVTIPESSFNDLRESIRKDNNIFETHENDQKVISEGSPYSTELNEIIAAEINKEQEEINLIRRKELSKKKTLTDEEKNELFNLRYFNK